MVKSILCLTGMHTAQQWQGKKEVKGKVNGIVPKELLSLTPNHDDWKLMPMVPRTHTWMGDK